MNIKKLITGVIFTTIILYFIYCSFVNYGVIFGSVATIFIGHVTNVALKTIKAQEAENDVRQ